MNAGCIEHPAITAGIEQSSIPAEIAPILTRGTPFDGGCIGIATEGSNVSQSQGQSAHLSDRDDAHAVQLAFVTKAQLLVIIDEIPVSHGRVRGF